MTNMTAANSASAVLADLAAVRPWQEDLYRDLHRHPELSHQEHRTAGKVAERLRQSGFRVHDGIGGTGVVGILTNGDGPTVLLRADMDALPVREATGLPYASTDTAADADGNEVPVMHACGHDVHVTSLLGAAQLLADHPDQWNGNLVALFQPAEEMGDGARGMAEDGLTEILPAVDVALAQHVLPLPAGYVGTRSGPVLSVAESLRITVYGRGGHGSMPQTTVDPVVLAAMIVVRLQTVVAREVAPGEFAVLTVGSIQAGTKSNIIPDSAVLQLNIRAYTEQTRSALVDAIRRIVTSECAASGSPKEPGIERFDRLPAHRQRRGRHHAGGGGIHRVLRRPCRRTAAPDRQRGLQRHPHGVGRPLHLLGRSAASTPTGTRRRPPRAGWPQDIPVNHHPGFAPVIQPTLDTGTQALVVAALAWLAPTGPR